MDLGWARPVFTRAKTPTPATPVIGSLPDAQSSAASTNSKDDPEEVIPTSTKLRSTPRMSSYIGFRPESPRVSSPIISVPDPFPNFHNPENVYHKPSADQQAELLKIQMMNQSNFDPIPVEFNSIVLHVLEAYQDLRTQLNAKDEVIEELKESNRKDIREFEDMAARWDQKESDYKAEVKSLEVILSKTEGGLESVTMARTMSVVHGTERASVSIKRGIGTIKERNSARNSQDAGKSVRY